MAQIKMTRIDYRLIHGQVVAKWIKYNPVSVIVVADNQLADDDFMADIYKMAAGDRKVEIVPVEKLSALLSQIDKSVMLIFRDVDSAYEAVEHGIKFSDLNVGAVEKTEDRVQIVQGVSLSESEVAKLQEIYSKGISVYAQPIPEQSKINIEDFKVKV